MKISAVVAALTIASASAFAPSAGMVCLKLVIFRMNLVQASDLGMLMLLALKPYILVLGTGTVAS